MTNIKELYEMKIVDDEDETFAISLVKLPAIKEQFIALAEQKPEVMLKVQDADKHILAGIILRPDVPIYRNHDGKEFHIFFSKETVEQSAERYLERSRQSNVTVQHEVPVDDVFLRESWLVIDEKNDKGNALGLNVKNGDWVGVMKVNNTILWDEFIKNDTLTGFSIEAVMSPILTEPKDVNMNSNTKSIMTDKNIITKIKEALGFQEEVVDAPVVDLTDEAPEVAPEVVEQEDEAPTYVSVEAFDALVARVEALEAPEEAPVEQEADETVLAEDEVATPEVVETELAEQKEVVVEEAAVELVAHTDVTEVTKRVKIKFDPKLSIQERIKQNLG